MNLKSTRCYVLLAVASCLPSLAAQSVDDLNLQFHGYATQSFLYTTRNNILTTNSSDGSAAWTEAVVNVTSVPTPRLRIGVQARYSLIGTLGNTITLDWAAADFKVNDRIGFRFGKVKTPLGLFNEVQDIDPAYQWVLLPQGVYPLLSRNSFLAHYGGVVYGTLPLAEKLGKLEYRGWSGEIVVSPNDGYAIPLNDGGLYFTSNINSSTLGASLRWKTPLAGLLLGASILHDGTASPTITAAGGALNGYLVLHPLEQPTYFASYERSRLSLAAEYSHFPPQTTIHLEPLPPSQYGLDTRAWYGMAGYKLTEKFTAGIYHSQWIDHAQALGASRFSKDWALSGRYDFSPSLYLKAEQHVIDGTGIVYSTAQNPGGLQPDTRLTLLKLGAVF